MTSIILDDKEWVWQWNINTIESLVLLTIDADSIDTISFIF